MQTCSDMGSSTKHKWCNTLAYCLDSQPTAFHKIHGLISCQLLAPIVFQHISNFYRNDNGHLCGKRRLLLELIHSVAHFYSSKGKSSPVSWTFSDLVKSQGAANRILLTGLQSSGSILVFLFHSCLAHLEHCVLEFHVCVIHGIRIIEWPGSRGTTSLCIFFHLQFIKASGLQYSDSWEG